MLYKFIDADGNSLGIHNVGENNPESYVGGYIDTAEIASVEQYTEPRVERDQVFAATIDRVNPVWFNSLSDDQKSELGVWRQAWLDYPETGVRPADLDWLQQ